MNDVMHSALPSLSTVCRWSARVLSALILLFWGFFIVAHLIGDAGAATRPLNFRDYLSLALVGGALSGLALAWKWELTGALITLGSIALGVLMSWKILATPYAVMPVTACLFLLSWWSHKQR